MEEAQRVAAGVHASPSPASRSFTGPNGTERVPVRSRLTVNTADAAIAAATAGLGITRVLSYQVSALLRAGALRRLLERYEPAAVPVSLLCARQGRLPAKTRSFLDLALSRLAHAPADAPAGSDLGDQLTGRARRASSSS